MTVKPCDSPGSSLSAVWVTAAQFRDTQSSANAPNALWVAANTIPREVKMNTNTSFSSPSPQSTSAELSDISSIPSPPPLSSPSDGNSSDGYLSPQEEGPDSTDSKSDTFQNMLFKALEDNEDFLKQRRFFPSTTFTELVNERAVEKELRNLYQFPDSISRRSLARTICGSQSFKKVFSLLAVVDRVSDIRLFIEENVADEDLPLIKMGLGGSNLFNLGRRDGSALSCFDAWGPTAMRMFEDWQWSTLAPTFPCGERKNISHTELLDNVPLPFTSSIQCGADIPMIRSGQSTVFKVNIHSAHHDFHRLQNMHEGAFAVKRLSSGDRDQFEREAEMLASFSGDAHPHLISLLATYEQHNVFNLIFPWAEADLQSFWQNINPNPSMSHETVLWVARQCLGIAQGLSALHHYRTISSKRLTSVFGKPSCETGHFSDTREWQLFGIHGDIKPQNVLWFRDRSKSADHGTLKLSDFGLSEFKMSANEIYRPSAQVALSASYRPPEYDCKDGYVGRSHDIWALGCLYLEMIGWLLGGWQLLNNFQRLRAVNGRFPYYGGADAAFFQVESLSKDGTATVVIKPVVTEFIGHLLSLPNCTEYLRSFLNLIQEEMLIIKPTCNEEKGRIATVELVARLNQMWQCCEGLDFSTMPVVQQKPKRSCVDARTTVLPEKRRRV